MRFTYTEQRGYLRVDLSNQRMLVDMVGMSRIDSPVAKAAVIASFEVTNGSAKLVRTA